MSHNTSSHLDRQPTLLAGPEDFARIRGFAPDSLRGRLLSFLDEAGEAMLPLPLLEEKLTGIRLLHVARQAFKRISTWALLYQLQSDHRWADRAAAELENICGFSSWNPRHFLDTAEMTLAATLGLDWLGNALEPDLQAKIKAAILEKGIKPSLDERAVHNWWLQTSNNWNPVCHSSLIAGVLALGSEHASLANQIIERARQHIPRAMDETLPDGIYPEGPAYWEFGTHYTVMAIELLRRARGHAQGLEDHTALFKSAHFLALSVAPSGNYYNFFDSRLHSSFAPVLCWFAAEGDETATYEMRRTLEQFLEAPDWQPDNDGHRLLVTAALWYPRQDEPARAVPSRLPRSWLGRGVNPIAVVREGFGDPRHFYFACKGGNGTISHAHLDAGSFILEDRGVRWALDLGMQEYHSLESNKIVLWDQHQHSDRWRIFRCGPYSHNLLLIDEQLPDVHGQAAIVSMKEAGDEVKITLDLTPLYPGLVQSYVREFAITATRVLRITDRISGARTADQRHNPAGAALHWRMVTGAAIETSGDRAVLRQDGETMHVRVLRPRDTRVFTLRGQSLENPPYWWDAPNPGVHALDLWTHADPAGEATISFVMSTDENTLKRMEE